MTAGFRGLALALIGLGGFGMGAGCRSDRDHTPGQTQDRVHVDVPFVNVRVGEHGGAKVDAPFTHVETPRYQQGAGSYSPAQVQTVPASPVSSSSQYTPAPVAAPAPASRRIAPAAGMDP